MNKILITQHFSRNKGNVSLLYTLVEAIRENIPEAEVIVSSYNPVETNKLFGYECCEWPFITRNIIEKKGLPRYSGMAKEILVILLQIIVAYLIRIKLINPQKLKGRLYFLNVMTSSDKIISPGGHLFTSFNQIGAVFAHFYPCLLSRILKMDFYVIAQTIGPFFGKLRFLTILLTRFVIDSSKFVSVRDSYSLTNLHEIGISSESIVKTNELVFLFPDSKSSSENLNSNEITIGITIHHLYYKHFLSREQYVKETIDLIKMILLQGRFRVKLISMEENLHDKGDLNMLTEIKSHFLSDSKISIDCISMDPREVLTTFSNLSFLIATKTHSVVYGLRCSIPTIAVAYDEKTYCFMKDFDLEEYSVSMKDYNARLVFETFQRIVSHERKIKLRISSNLHFIQEQAFRNIQILSL